MAERMKLDEEGYKLVELSKEEARISVSRAGGVSGHDDVRKSKSDFAAGIFGCFLGSCEPGTIVTGMAGCCLLQ
jgi:hypothetical protein